METNGKNLVNFDFEQNRVRTMADEKGVVWFCLKDVCEILEIANPSNVADRLDKAGVVTMEVSDANSHGQRANFVNEPNLYRVIFESRKPNAKKFQDWVFNEVLPSIRKTGGYSLPGAELRLGCALKFVEGVRDILRMDNTSSIRILRKVASDYSIPENYLPVYVEDDVTESATTLLRRNNVQASVREFNKAMLRNGFLEQKTRPSSKGKGIRKFWSLTESGLEYGKNLISPSNQKETQPHYFSDKFPGLLKIMGMLED